MWRPLESVRSFFRSDASRARPADLLGEQGGPRTGEVNREWREPVANRLTPEYLAHIFRAADEGDPGSYLTLAEEMEEREPHFRSVIGTRKLALSGLPREVKSASDDAHDVAIAEHVHTIMQRPEAEGLVTDLADALSKGFACVETMWDRDVKLWEPVEWKFRSARHFVWDRDTLSIPSLRTLAKPFEEGEPLQPYKWLVHKPRLASGVPLRAGLARPVAVAYAAKRYTITDWMAFLDVFGIPARVGKFPSNMEKKKNDLLRALRSLGTDACAVIPIEMEVEFLQAKGGGSGGSIFREGAEYWDKQTSKVVLGQTMSTDDGSSLAQAKVHETVRFDIRAADARALAATINRDFVKPFVDLNYGPQKKYPELWFPTAEPENKKELMESTKIFVDLGGEVEMSSLRDRLGHPEPEKGAKLLQPSAKVTADAQPKDEPAQPGKPAQNGTATEANRRQVLYDAFKEYITDHYKAEDNITDLLDNEEIREWRPLLDGSVGELLRRVESAHSFEEAAALIQELADDKGIVLDVASFVRALAKSTFKSRGIGNATDDPRPP